MAIKLEILIKNQIKLKFFLIFIFLIYSKSAISQVEDLDSIDLFNQKLSEFYETNQDSAQFYIQKLKNYTQKNDLLADWIDAHFSANRIAIFYNDFETSQHNLAVLDSVFNKDLQKILQTNDGEYLYNTYLFEKGQFFFEVKQNEHKALEHFLRLKDRYSITKNMHEDDIYTLIIAQMYIADIYAKNGEYELANDYYKENIRLTKEHFAEEKGLMLQNQNLIGLNFQKMNQFQLSNQFMLLPFAYALEHKIENRIVTTGCFLADNYIQLNMPDSANYFLQKVKENLSVGGKYENKYYELLSRVELNQNKPQIARIHLQKSLELLRNRWGNQPNFQSAKVYLNLSNISENQGNTKLALAENQQGIQQVFGEKIPEYAMYQNVYLQLLKQKSKLLNKAKNYNETITTVEESLEILDKIKPTFDTNQDKLFLIENTYPTIENGLLALYSKHLKTNDNQSIAKAFYLIEKSKATLLMESIVSANVQNFAEIPEDLLEKETEIKNKIVQIESELIASEKPDIAQENQLFELKEDLHTTIKILEKEYKNYFDLKYNSKVIDLSEFQSILGKDQIFITYFFGNENIYGISVTKQDKKFIIIENNSNLKNQIQQLIIDFKNPKSNVQTLAKNSNTVYLKVLRPLLINSNANKIIISADGGLNYLPFAAFNTAENGQQYLIEKYKIAYVNSATMYNELLNRTYKNREVLAFAPGFENKNSNFLSLPKNKAEVKSIFTHFNGKSFLGEKATFSNFNQHYKDFGILHLASHAVLNDKNPAYSYLAFEPDSTQNLLYLNQIYNLKFNAEMVTLSACETGIGKMHRGEGLLSLARGFYYGGVSSIASSLWKINDGSTAQIMDEFYKHLSKGKTKDEALQRAQLDFINKNQENQLSHPYYWASFVVSGNTQPVKNKWSLWWLIPISMVFIGSIYAAIKYIK